MKPRIRRAGGQWVCAGRGCGGIGKDPSQAFSQWKAMALEDLLREAKRVAQRKVSDG